MKPVIVEMIKKKISGLFDEQYYKNQWHDVDWEGVDPIEHYITVGWKEGRDPRPDFSVDDYVQKNANLRNLDIEPLYHWLTSRKKLSTNETAYIATSEDMSDITRVRETVASIFDTTFYFMQAPEVAGLNVDPVEHYVMKGWRIPLDPHPDFSVSLYLKNNPDIAARGIEPYYHWISIGRNSGIGSDLSLYPAKTYTQAEMLVRPHFDAAYYLEKYPDVKEIRHNPLIHYMRGGWREGRNPNRTFKTADYMLNHPDAIASGHNPFLHYVIRYADCPLVFDEVATVKKYLSGKIFHAYQDVTFPLRASSAEKIMVFVLPEHNEMSGGIYSIYSIASIVKRLRYRHGYEVLLMTRPNKLDATYCRQKNFSNSEDVYRLAQIERCRNVRELYFNIPEYAAQDFVASLLPSTFNFIKSVPTVYVNILNQNIDLMPERHAFDDLRQLSTDHLSQSVAHHSYFSQEYANRYELTTLLLPAYTDLSGYSPTTFHEKDNLIIYSPDDAPHKSTCLDAIRRELPEFKLVEIRNITFDEYMNLATNCKYSLSFGEGFDGYIAQPIYQGGLGLTVFKEEFFPSSDYLDYDIFFSSRQDMIENICKVIRRYEGNPAAYSEINKELIVKYEALYNYEDYVSKVVMLIDRDFDLIPGGGNPADCRSSFRVGLASKNPLISHP